MANPLDPPGVETDDDALILWMLSLTPRQRLDYAQGFIDSVAVLRNGYRPDHPAARVTRRTRPE